MSAQLPVQLPKIKTQKAEKCVTSLHGHGCYPCAGAHKPGFPARMALPVWPPPGCPGGLL